MSPLRSSYVGFFAEPALCLMQGHPSRMYRPTKANPKEMLLDYSHSLNKTLSIGISHERGAYACEN